MGNESLKVLENSLNFLFLKGYEPCTLLQIYEHFLLFSLQLIIGI